MSQSESILIAPLPKPVVRIGTPIAAILLTGFFILWGFPYHHLTNRVAAMAGDTLGVEMRATESGLTIGLDGPGFRFRDIRVETRSGEVYQLESIRLGPAWSLSWFTATPTLFFDVESEIGNSAGTVRTGDAPAWSGSIGELSIDELTFLETMLPITLTGTLNAEGDLESSDGVPTGPFTFDLQDGLIGHPIFPLDIPYKTIQGAVAFGGEHLLSIESFELIGPLLSFNVGGSVGQADSIDNSPLDLDIEFKNVPPQMRSILQSIGGRVGRDGSSKLHVSGTLTNPIVK
jgi:type II secretion system protein N